MNNKSDKITISYVDTEYKPYSEEIHFHDEYSMIYVKEGKHIFENND